MAENFLWKEIKDPFLYGKVLSQLIVINTVVFIGLIVLRIILGLSGNPTFFYDIIAYLAVPYKLSAFIVQPWSIFTYMFVHYEFIHFIFNMLWLYWFGQIFVLFLGDKRLLSVYVLGAISGAILYIILLNTFTNFQQSGGNLIGASAGIMAIVAASATLRPDYTVHLVFLGPVRIKYIALFAIVFDLFMISEGRNIGGQISHLGGVAWGFLYIKQLQNGNNLGLGFENLFDRVKNIFSARKPKVPEVVYRSPKIHTKVHAQRAESENNSSPVIKAQQKQARLDEILDKIGASGYDSLTKEEKEFLFLYSKEK
ncbi:MAG: rhomboid family intramembrane serine protease [Chitinophagales bacterium]|nr:rhomboid family intramembrane serine protease [Bacteroidota bacterium]